MRGGDDAVVKGRRGRLLGLVAVAKGGRWRLLGLVAVVEGMTVGVGCSCEGGRRGDCC